MQHWFITYVLLREGTHKRFILMLYFDTSDIFFVAVFILDFLRVSSDF